MRPTCGCHDTRVMSPNSRRRRNIRIPGDRGGPDNGHHCRDDRATSAVLVRPLLQRLPGADRRRRQAHLPRPRHQPFRARLRCTRWCRRSHQLVERAALRAADVVGTRHSGRAAGRDRRAHQLAASAADPHRLAGDGGDRSVGGLVGRRAGVVVRAAAGAAIGGGLYLLVWLLSRGGFGFGDVRFAPLLGAAAAAEPWTLLWWTCCSAPSPAG